jgi:hypothetical protein
MQAISNKIIFQLQYISMYKEHFFSFKISSDYGEFSSFLKGIISVTVLSNLKR